MRCTKQTHFPKEIVMVLKLLASMLAVSFIVSGCNTIQGAGKDIESGGQKIQDTAEKAKK
jgi:predicted small secreted protein